MLINNIITLNRLYVSRDAGEKHAALLAEISRLREVGAGREADPHPDRLQPCRGAISINNIQLPLKVEFVCSARTGEFRQAERCKHHRSCVVLVMSCVSVQFVLLTTFSSWSDTERVTSWPLRWVLLLTLRTETPSPFLRPSRCQSLHLLLKCGSSWPCDLSCHALCVLSRQDIRSNFEIDVEVYSLVSRSVYITLLYVTTFSALFSKEFHFIFFTSATVQLTAVAAALMFSSSARPLDQK